jgi:OST-HTH/LOTUS domain
VEKLKQYGRKVIVVGGRQFTSATMQRNCHEFIAYENLVGSRGGRSGERGGRHSVAAGTDVSKALPLVKRALKVLSEREVAPQLGLLKSTLLQLDSTFSEREYGAGSFRDFMEKVAQAGAVTLKHAGRSLLVDAVEEGGMTHAEAQPVAPERTVEAPAPQIRPSDSDEEEMPTSELGNAEGVRAVQQAFSSGTPRWPMYIRQAKQYLKTSIENFDERRYGFATVVDLFRAAAKTGVVRIERDRQGGMRIFPGANLKAAQAAAAPASDVIETVEPLPGNQTIVAEIVDDDASEPPIVDAEVTETGGNVVAEPAGAGPEPKPARKRTSRGGRSAKTKSKEPHAAAKGAKPRARKSARGKPAEAADVP